MRRGIGFAVVLLAFCLAAFAASAETRIGVVDMEQIFREFYKSRIAEEAIKQQAGIYRDYVRRMNEQLEKLAEEARFAQRNAQNYALSEAERANAEQKTRAAVRRVSEKRAELELYTTERSADMRKLEEGKRAEILKEIHAQVKKSAAGFGYDFVLDSSGKSMNSQSVLVLFPAGRDFTQSVITELNRTRSKTPGQTGAKRL